MLDLVPARAVLDVAGGAGEDDVLSIGQEYWPAVTEFEAGSISSSHFGRDASRGGNPVEAPESFRSKEDYTIAIPGTVLTCIWVDASGSIFSNPAGRSESFASPKSSTFT